MAQYKVQAPDGEIIVLEGPDGATDAEIFKQAQNLYRPKGDAGGTKYPAGLAGVSKGTGNPLTGFLESVASIGSGIVSSIPAGIVGLGEIVRAGGERHSAGESFGQALSGGVQDAAKVVQDIQARGTYVPRTDTGQQYTEKAAQALNFIPAAAGNAVIQNTQGWAPEARATAATAAEIVADPLNLLGIKGVRSAAAKTAVAPYTVPRDVVRGISSGIFDDAPKSSFKVTPEAVQQAKAAGEIGAFGEKIIKSRGYTVPREGRALESFFEDLTKQYINSPTKAGIDIVTGAVASPLLAPVAVTQGAKALGTYLASKTGIIPATEQAFTQQRLGRVEPTLSSSAVVPATANEIIGNPETGALYGGATNVGTFKQPYATIEPRTGQIIPTYQQAIPIQPSSVDSVAPVQPTAVEPAVQPTAVEPAVQPTAVEPAVQPTAVEPAVPSVAVMKDILAKLRAQELSNYQPETGLVSPAVPSVLANTNLSMKDKLAQLKAQSQSQTGLVAPDLSKSELRSQQRDLKTSVESSNKEIISRIAQGEPSGVTMVSIDKGASAYNDSNLTRGQAKKLVEMGVDEIPVLPGMTDSQVINSLFKEMVAGRGRKRNTPITKESVDGDENVIPGTLFPITDISQQGLISISQHQILIDKMTSLEKANNDASKLFSLFDNRVMPMQMIRERLFSKADYSAPTWKDVLSSSKAYLPSAELQMFSDIIQQRLNDLNSKTKVELFYPQQEALKKFHRPYLQGMITAASREPNAARVGVMNFGLLDKNDLSKFATSALHESVHELTITAYAKNTNNFATEINQLYDNYKNMYVGDLPGQLSKEEMRGVYGFTDPEEFLSEALSNTGFQRLLRAIQDPRHIERMEQGRAKFLESGSKVDGKLSLWDRLVDVVSKLISKITGRPTTQANEALRNNPYYLPDDVIHNILDRVLQASEDANVSTTTPTPLVGKNDGGSGIIERASDADEPVETVSPTPSGPDGKIDVFGSLKEPLINESSYDASRLFSILANKEHKGFFRRGEDVVFKDENQLADETQIYKPDGTVVETYLEKDHSFSFPTKRISVINRANGIRDEFETQRNSATAIKERSIGNDDIRQTVSVGQDGEVTYDLSVNQMVGGNGDTILETKQAFYPPDEYFRKGMIVYQELRPDNETGGTLLGDYDTWENDKPVNGNTRPHPLGENWNKPFFEASEVIRPEFGDLVPENFGVPSDKIEAIGNPNTFRDKISRKLRGYNIDND